VLDPKQITQIFGKVNAEFGKLDIFVSNARPEAATFFYPPMEITLEQLPRPIPRQKRFSSLCTRRFHSWIKAGESWLSPMPRGAVRADCDPGSAWVQPRPRSNLSYVTSRSLSPNAASQ